MSQHPSRPSPTKKRQRASDEEEQCSLGVTRSEELWFDDGNIIIQAGKTQFRVHRGHISVHSSFFKGMLLVPQPVGEPKVEGCPVIHVYDRAKDWENLLMAMYNIFKTNRMQKDYTMDRILSLLRLGHKYQFDHFRNIATEYLKENFPTNLEDWDMCSAHIDDMTTDNEEGEEPCTSGFEFELVNTVMEVGMRSILPAVFFVCLRDRTLEEIFAGYKLEDGTVVTLSPEVQQILVSARSRISRRAIMSTILNPLAEVQNARATHQVDCKSLVQCKIRSQAADNRMLLFTVEPGAALQKSEDLCSCEPCNNHLTVRMESGRKIIWDNLPRYFGLPSWDDAKDFEG